MTTDSNEKDPQSKGEQVAVDDQEEFAGAEMAMADTGQAASREEAEPEDLLEHFQAEAARWRDRALRSQADLDNYRKRMAREKSDAIRFANVALLEQLLPVLDTFYLGLQAARTEGRDENSTIYQGMAMVLKQMEDFLRDQGVEPVETGGADFDPNLHEAVGNQHSADVPEGRILSEVRRGYRMKERLLRAPAVVVSKGPAEGAG